MAEPLRCLSLQQPWAWAVSVGLKTVENRTWSTPYRGRIALHASRSRRWVNEICREFPGLPLDREAFVYGAVVGVAELVEVQPHSWALRDNRWAAGPLCWLFEQARPLPEPIPALGRLQLYRLDENISAAVREQCDRPVAADEPPALAAWREALERFV